MKDAEEIAREIGKALCKVTPLKTISDEERANAYAYVLREAGLVEVLEAGQAMRDCNYINTANSMAWDAAVTRLAGEGSA